MAIFPIAYFPPISWFSAAIQYDFIELEVSQHFRKQQYTNRMWIKGANGDMKLSIPVGRKGARMPIKEKKISYEVNWQLQHFRSWEAAYRNSPYYEYYIDSFQPLFQKRPVFLVDHLEQAILICQQKLGLSWDIKMSEDFHPLQKTGEIEWRSVFDPTRQKPYDGFQAVKYPQVFDGFSPDLSIVDLLFNEGQASLSILQKCLTIEG
ncbi:MAG: WbqC family protein [Bacteroidia bacterium]